MVAEHGLPELDEDQSVTTASMVWEPAEGRAHIACGQPCEAEYVTYRL